MSDLKQKDFNSKFSFFSSFSALIAKARKIWNEIKNKKTLHGNNVTKKQQYRNLAIIVLSIVGITTFVLVVKDNIGSNPSAKEGSSQESLGLDVDTPSKGQMIDFASPLNHVDQQSVWIQRAENKLSDQMKAQQDLSRQENTTQTQVSEQQDFSKIQQKQIEDLVQQLATLKNDLDQQKADAAKQAQEQRMIQPAGEAGANYYGGPQMIDTHIHLIPKPKIIPKRKKTPETYVPPGAYVTAAVLQGVDASAGVTSQSDPRPVLLRTITRGTLPGNYKSNLKNCLIVGSGYGDVSSERVYVRLETMSCTRHGEEIDYPVYGYISGTDAKTGQHGAVVFRDGPFVERAFVGGFLNGIGNVGQQYSQNSSNSPLGSVSTLDPKKIPVAGAAGGVGTAGQMYAQYNIQRAEQYQPVVEFSAGNVIDVVFTKGFWLDGHTDKNGDVNRVNQSSSSNQYSDSSDFSDASVSSDSSGQQNQQDQQNSNQGSQNSDGSNNSDSLPNQMSQLSEEQTGSQ